MSVFRAFRERDEEKLFAHYSPEIEWDLRGYSIWADRPLYKGHDGIREFFRMWLEDFSDYETEALNPIDVDDRVVVTVVDRAQGKRSGAVIERVHDQVWTIRDGLVVRVQLQDNRAQALKLVGLAMDAGAR